MSDICRRLFIFALLTFASSTALAQNPFRVLAVPPGSTDAPPMLGAALRALGADQPMARVDGEPITRSDLTDLLAASPPGSEFRPAPEAYPSLLEAAIGRRLLARAGRAAGLARDPKVRAAVAAAEDREIGEAFLVREQMARATAAARQARYEAFRAESPVRQELRVRELLTTDAATAQTALDDIAAGMDFAEAARRWSIDPSAPRGGEVGFILAEDVEPALAEAAYALAPGAVSPAPIKSKLGWYLLKVEEARPSKRISYIEERDEIALDVAADARLAIVEELRRAARVERFDWNGAPLR